MRRIPFIVASAIGASVPVPHIAAAQGIYVEGRQDCALWVEARKKDTAVALEHYLVGLLNGLSLGSGIEFWHAQGVPVSRDQVFLWMDNYCQGQPLSTAVAGAIEIINERTNNAWTRRPR